VTGRATASDLREHTAELSSNNVSAFGVDSAGELYLVEYGGPIVRISLAQPPAMSIDVPARNQTLTQPFAIAGWAVDPNSGSGSGIDAIHVWAYPLPAFGAAPSGSPVFLGATTTAFDRPDVAAAFGSPQLTRSGYALNVTGLQPGVYLFAVFGLVHSSGAFSLLRTVEENLRVQTTVTVDVPRSGATVGSAFGIGGWAIDQGAPSGTGVDAIHVWAYPAAGGNPVFLGSTTTFGDRPDIGAIFGARFTRSGFTLSVNAPPPGAWNVFVFAHSTATGLFQVSAPVRVTR
jgi:hypothetical protein